MPANKSQISFFLILLAVVWGFLVGANALLADWSAPTASPPGNQPAPFLSTDATAQTKTGTLTIDNDFYVTGNSLTGRIGLGTTTATSAKLVIDPTFGGSGNAAIDAGNGWISTGWSAQSPKDVINKDYLTSTLSASLDPIKYWTLSGSNLYASSTAYKVAIGTTTAGTAKLEVYGGDIKVEGGSLLIADTVGQTTTRLQSYGSASSLWLVQPTTQSLILADAVSWDRNVAISYTAGTTGAGAGRLTIGQVAKNGASFTHGVTSLYTNGLERLRINSGGKVGIGTTSPGYLLDVNGGARFNGTIQVYTPAAASDAATKDYVDASAQSLWINSGSYLYASSTSWRVGIGTTSPSSALHLYPQTGIEGLRIVSSDYAPLVVRDTTDQDDLFRVNQYGDVTAVTSSATKMRSNAYCDASGANCFDPNGGWSAGVTTIFLTSTTTNGSFTFTGGYTGYDAGNKICNSEQTGSHFCRTDEIVYLIQKNGASGFSSINGQNAWMADGPPGYTGATAADDCAGWTNGTTSNLGHFWIFNSTGGGVGALIHCGTVKKITCCK